MKEIKLTQGKVALVDDEDYERVNHFKWQAFNKGKVWRAIGTTSRRGGVKSTTIYMHQLIMGSNPEKLLIDHRDGDGLNNQKYNLRFCTTTQNCINRGANAGGTTEYKGVSRDKRRLGFVGRIRVYGELFYVGYSRDKHLLAKRCDAVSMYFYGEFSKLNFNN